MKRILLIISTGLILLFLSIEMTNVKNDDHNYSLAQKNGAVVKYSDKSIQLEWSELKDWSLGKQEFKKLSDKNYSVIGYLVYIFEEYDENRNVNKFTRILPEYNHRIYFTKERCLSINNAKPETNYAVYIRYMIEFQEDKAAVLIGFDNNFSITEKSCISFKTQKISNTKKADTICRPEEIKRVKLKNMINDRDEYINKLVIIKGKINPEKKVKYEISKCVMRSDASIYDGVFSICIPSLWSIIMRNEIEGEVNNELTILGYLSKVMYKNNKQEKEQVYSFVPVSILEMK